MTNQTILVTGSSGTIGTRLCEKLLAQGVNCIGIDRVPNKWRPEVQEITIVGDLLDQATFDQLPQNIDTIIHLAANARVYDLVQKPELAMENIQTIFNTLEFARKKQIKQFIFASSREVYGNQLNPNSTATPEPQTHINHIESPYSASKFSGEALVHSYYHCYQQDYIIFRFSNVYGMYDDSDRVIPLFIRNCQTQTPLTVFGKDKHLDFTYIDDTIAGIISALNNFPTAKNETYNLAFGQATSLIAVAELIKQHFPSFQAPISVQSTRTGEVINYLADITKSQQKLNFHPLTSIQEGIIKSVHWYLENKML